MFASFLLFIAMIGSIVLTLNKKIYNTIKMQNSFEQSLKNSKNSIYILKKLK
jgi:hypothetical protein